MNLLVALDALLTQRNVSRAARQLGLSQPTLSAALRRLRAHFDDELLTRVGNSYELTTLAHRIAPHVRVTLENVERVFDAQLEFDPATSTRHFRIIIDDYTLQVLGGSLVRLFEQRAPHAQLQFQPINPHVLQRAGTVLLTQDLIIAPRGFVEGMPHEDLFHDWWVPIASPGNPKLTGTVTTEMLAAQEWVVQFHGIPAATPMIGRLKALGLEPHISTVTHSCLTVPGLISGTGRVAALPERLAKRMPPEDIEVLPAPFDLPSLVEAMWWHPLREHDPEHTVLRAIVSAAAREIGRTTPGRT